MSRYLPTLTLLFIFGEGGRGKKLKKGERSGEKIQKGKGRGIIPDMT
jgi:hypothetical protein